MAVLMRRTSLFRHVAGSIGGLFLLFAFPALCLSQEREGSIAQGVEIVSDGELERLRGGFVLPNGMTVNISIDQSIFRNGIRTHASYFELPEQFLSTMTNQLSRGNPVAVDAFGSLTQNALNNQLIEIMRIVDIELFNLPNVTFDATGSGLVNPLAGNNF